MARSRRLYRVTVDWYNEDNNIFDFCGNAWAYDANEAIRLIASRTVQYYHGETGDEYEHEIRSITNSVYPDRVVDVIDEMMANLQQLILGEKNSSSAKKREAFSNIAELLKDYGITHSRRSEGVILSLDQPLVIYRCVETASDSTEGN